MSKSKKSQKETPKPVAVVPDVLKNATQARLRDERLEAAFPTLHACLMPQYEGPTLLRPPGKITFAVEGVYWRITLDLPYERLTCRILVETLTEGLQSLETYLASGRAVFTPAYDRNKKKLPTLDAAIE